MSYHVATIIHTSDDAMTVVVQGNAATAAHQMTGGAAIQVGAHTYRGRMAGCRRIVLTITQGDDPM